MEHLRRMEALIGNQSPNGSIQLISGRLFNQPINEPSNTESTQLAITRLVKNKQALIILDNAIAGTISGTRSPSQTEFTIFLTTRNRNMANRLRNRYRMLSIRPQRSYELHQLVREASANATTTPSAQTS